jgi:uncharacterized protein (TIGR02147 family)
MEAQKSNSSKSKSNKKRDFRFYLQDELAARCAKNPNYSLRSFAKMLSVSPSALSAMINGKRPITNKMKETLGLKLGLSFDEIQNLNSRPHGNSKTAAVEYLNGMSFQQVTIDQFAIISEPHYYALLELMKTQDFKWDRKWIAQRLKKTISEINFSIERLERVGLLERNADGTYQDGTDGFSSDIRDGLSSQAQRQFQQRSLEQAIEAINQVPVDNRDNTSMTMAINSKDIAKAKKFLKEFRRKFCADLESNPILNEVYQLTISFIPLTERPGGQK